MKECECTIKLNLLDVVEETIQVYIDGELTETSQHLGFITVNSEPGIHEIQVKISGYHSMRPLAFACTHGSYFEFKVQPQSSAFCNTVKLINITE